MRLSPAEAAAICRILVRHLGNRATVYLFGSRTDDSRRGGDVDVLVEMPIRPATTCAANWRPAWKGRRLWAD